LKHKQEKFTRAKPCALVFIMRDYTEKNILTVIDDIKPSVKSVLNHVERQKALSDERKYEIELVLNELLVNCFRHANPSAELPVELAAGVDDGKLFICVTDCGAGFEYKKAFDETSDVKTLYRERGRGLMLVKAFCEEIRYNLKGNSVEVEIAL
jgi:anti-sigma regulatory factor (Ser/Thr protein kinase)